jgi:hypothetical protein
VRHHVLRAVENNQRPDVVDGRIEGTLALGSQNKVHLVGKADVSVAGGDELDILHGAAGDLCREEKVGVETRGELGDRGTDGIIGAGGGGGANGQIVVGLLRFLCHFGSGGAGSGGAGSGGTGGGGAGSAGVAAGGHLHCQQQYGKNERDSFGNPFVHFTCPFQIFFLVMRLLCAWSSPFKLCLRTFLFSFFIRRTNCLN